MQDSQGNLRLSKIITVASFQIFVPPSHTRAEGRGTRHEIPDEVLRGGFPGACVPIPLARQPHAGGASATPYNYSDMTGFVSIGGTTPSGSWTVVHDCTVPATKWGMVSWTCSTPQGTSIKVEVRAADTQAGLPALPFAEVGNGVPFCDPGILGQFIEVRATLSHVAGIATSPVLYDLALRCCNRPPIAQCQDIIVGTDPGTCQATVTPAQVDNGSSDPDNDPLTFALTPAGPYPLGVTAVTLTVTDPQGASDSCPATITVVDNEPPQIICPADMVVPTDPGRCDTVVSFVATAADNCPGVSVTCAPPSGSVFPNGETIVACSTQDAAGNTASCSFKVTVEDREAPTAACVPTTNPSGNNVPKAGSNPKSGQNPDGFYQLLGADNCGALQLFVRDSASGFVAGPFNPGDKVKITQAPGVTPNQKPMSGVIVAHIQLNGDAQMYAVDSSGNISVVCSCLVPPPPK